MASQKSSKTSHVFARHVAPLAPLALGLAMSALPSSQAKLGGELAEEDIPDTVTAVQCEDNIAGFQECHDDYPTGCSKAGRYDAYLNLLKNELPTAPTGAVAFLDQAAFDNLNTNTPPDLSKTNHIDFKDQLSQLRPFGEGNQYGLIGYLYYGQSTGAESSNCQLTGTKNVDFHIGIGFDSSFGALVRGGQPDASLKKQLQQKSVIVEMTPHYRARFHNTDWTLANLKPALGHKVKVVGLLIVDSEHNKPSDNCALDGTAKEKNHCWRYSVWELHPVTVFEYCQDDSCTETSKNWIPLGGSSGQASPSAGSAEDDDTASGADSTDSDGVAQSRAGTGRERRAPRRTAKSRSSSAVQP